MKIIGLTGGVGSGKSTAMQILKEKYGACVIIADELGHLAMEKNSETYCQIVTLFGEGILDKEGRIDRKRLGDIVFLQPEKLKALNEIIHPFVKEKIKELLRQAKEEGTAVVLLESAILLESGYEGICDEIWMVTAEKEIRFRRLEASRGYTREKFEAILKRQQPEDRQKKRVHEIILNNGDKASLERQIDSCIKKLKKYP